MLPLQHHVDLTPLNTLHLTSMASNYRVLHHVGQLETIVSEIQRFRHFFVLGGGSNLILPIRYEGLVIHNQLLGIEMIKTGEECIVTAMAGEDWDAFVAYCCANGAHGLENLSLIPGTVGACPIQNIGAYGIEVKDFISEVLVYDLHTTKLVKLSNHDCHFAYRHSLLKNNPRYIVISVSFRLSSKPQLNLTYSDVAKKISSIATPTPRDLRNTIIDIRKNKLPNPKDLGNVGSFFHNPVLPEKQAHTLRFQYPNLPTFPTTDPSFIKVSAGWLIDNLGLKGLRHGNVGVYSEQALVLINYGNACQSELLEFAAWIQSKVNHHYQVELHIEPIILT